MLTVRDPEKNLFNDWLQSNGIYVALGVAAVLLIIVGVLLIMNAKKKR